MSVQILNPTKYPVNQMGLSKFHSPGSPLSATITSCSSDLFIVSGDLKKNRRGSGSWWCKRRRATVFVFVLGT